MGRSLRMVRGHAPGDAVDGGAVEDWWSQIERNARAHGALPYRVEGFTEISDAVRRGHAVLVRRETVEVADGIVVFDDARSGAPPQAFGPSLPEQERAVAVILRFDPSTARFVLQDMASAAGAIQLTPRRLARYLEHPTRSTGIALGS